jgi:hypothetical protein
MYGGSVVNFGNNDKNTQLKEQDFVNSYQNDDATGKKMFVVLWLHAYKYCYRDIVAKTSVPDWATFPDLHLIK